MSNIEKVVQLTEQMQACAKQQNWPQMMVLKRKRDDLLTSNQFDQTIISQVLDTDKTTMKILAEYKAAVEARMQKVIKGKKAQKAYQNL